MLAENLYNVQPVQREHRVYTIEANNKELRNEIQNLKVSIQEHGSRSQIEKEASQKLGMIYPTSSQFVKIGKHNKETDFANKLKQEAFK